MGGLLQAHGKGAPEALDWLFRLEAWRYAGGSPAPDKPALRHLRRQLRRLRWFTA
jgi:hypothetical protein